jgi:hypothetical protein
MKGVRGGQTFRAVETGLSGFAAWFGCPEKSDTAEFYTKGAKDAKKEGGGGGGTLAIFARFV